MINNDQPKNSIKEDELGYSYLSYYFAKIIKEVETLTKDKLWKENEWIADYRRLRVVAHI